MSHDEKYLLCEYNHKMRRCATVIMGEGKKQSASPVYSASKTLTITNKSPGETSYWMASLSGIFTEFPLEISVTLTDLTVVCL